MLKLQLCVDLSLICALIMKLLQFLLFIFAVYLCFSERTVVFVGKQTDCKEYNKNYFYNLSCPMKPINRNVQTYSLYVSLKPVVIQNVHVRDILYYSIPYPLINQSGINWNSFGWHRITNFEQNTVHLVFYLPKMHVPI